MGATGDVTGQHLHYEISHGGETIDPLPYINRTPINVNEIVGAIIKVESSNNDSAYCASEDAVGCLQIRRTMVDDVNRILKRQGKDKRYVYIDRWSREKSIDYLASNTALPIHECETEIDRYISWPGQALGYKIGELKIKELRQIAKEELGDNFTDIRSLFFLIQRV